MAATQRAHQWRGEECAINEDGAPGERSNDTEPRTWKIIIADDEEEVHSMTRMVLTDFRFDGRGVTLFNAYSAADTLRLLKEHPDTAMILLDVVMETDDAGLQVVRQIRRTLANPFVRIILRTGQPGKAPENQIIAQYDINDYKEKTELTVQKLYTAVTSSLRTYRDMRVIDQNRRGLEKIIDASADLFKIDSLNKFAQGVLMQLISLHQVDEDSALFQGSGLAASQLDDHFVVMAGTGRYEASIGRKINDVVPAEVMAHLENAMQQGDNIFHEDIYAGCFTTLSGRRHLLFLKGCRRLGEMDRDLITIFATNVGIAFENMALNQEIIDTQKEVIYTLSEVLESRLGESGNHVRRVAEISYHLALRAGLSRRQAELLRLVAPLHDLGKVGIPDAILLKTGALTADEFEIMKQHTDIGHRLTKDSSRHILAAAIVAAQQHHEQWDGGGYPQGLKGRQIHIFGRLIAIADVLDALLHSRSYKEAWAPGEAVAYIGAHRGTRFDPHLVDVFLAFQEELTAVAQRYPDEEENIRDTE